MDEKVIHELIHQAIDQIESTTVTALKWSNLIEDARNMRANEDAQIYQHLETAFKGLFNPNEFPTYRDPQGHRKEIIIGNRVLEIVVIHREMKLENLHGVDVFYHLGGWKALAFQHKKRSPDGTFSFSSKEREQRDKIQHLCDACRIPRRFQAGTSSYLKPYCSSVYVIGDAYGSMRHVVSTCMIEKYRDDYRMGLPPTPSFPQPPDLDTVDKMFLQCMVGRTLEDKGERISLQLMEDAFLTNPDLLIRARLSRRG